MSVPSSVLFVQRNANSNFVFRDDPVWEDWYEDAHGVQGGLEDSGSSSESEDEIAQPVILPTTCICNHCRLVPVFRIHDIFVWIRIRIRGSMPLNNGSGSGSGSWIRILLFSSLTFKMPPKTNFLTPFLLLTAF